MDIKEMVFESRCQKCGTPPTIMPLENLWYELIPDVIFIPENLRCAKCFSYMTTAVRKRKDDKKSKEN